jgi:hypothetical protein
MVIDVWICNPGQEEEHHDQEQSHQKLKNQKQDYEYDDNCGDGENGGSHSGMER